MPSIILKPIMWNPEGYIQPAGYPAKGYPEESGFGHEEWNNSPRMAFTERGAKMRAFHTERVWKPGDAAAAEEAVVLMYASHDGLHELVGAAARARCLVDEEEVRVLLAATLKLEALSSSAWRQPTVKAAYEKDRDAFQASWKKGLSWIPNWTCPADHYFQPVSPVKLDPWRIRGTTKLLTMFGRYTTLDNAAGMRVLLSVPHEERDANWYRIAGIIGVGISEAIGISDDVDDTRHDPTLDTTTKHALIAARRGQGRFRKQVALRWQGTCSVSGCAQQEVLRASHVQPWWLSTNAQRLDPANGLFLSAHLDALFDVFLISFDEDGDMMVSHRIKAADRKLLGLPRQLRRKPTKDEVVYLATHWERFAEVNRSTLQ